MEDRMNYPENRLDIRVDEQGNVTYSQNPVFAKYYAKTREELEEELEELRHELDMLRIDVPYDPFGAEYEDWEDKCRDLEDQIEDLEAELGNDSGTIAGISVQNISLKKS